MHSGSVAAMPRYDYLCECGQQYEADRPYAQRQDPVPCQCGQQAQYIIARAPLIGTEPGPKGDSRVIWDDRQIESSHGQRWRETKMSHREGGAGSVQYYDISTSQSHRKGSVLATDGGRK